MKSISSTNKTTNVYEYNITDEDLDENNEVDVGNLKPSNVTFGNKSYNDLIYNLVVFPKNFTIEYFSDLRLTLRVANGKFGEVVSSSFNIPNMSVGGSYSGISKSYYFNNARTSCSYNVNYTAEFGYEIPIFDFGIPIKYSKPMNDYLIVYY